MNFETVIEQLMRPLGGGIPAFSNGVGSEKPLQETYYKFIDPKRSIKDLWFESFKKVKKAKVVVIGVPLDTGAGIRRGAAYGPRAIREELLKRKNYQLWIQEEKILDLGDVFVNPHLLHDTMLNEQQIKKCQEAMYPDLNSEERKELPVSALSQLEKIISLLWQENPDLNLFVIGGDHSCAWPISKIFIEKFKKESGLVQPDAHTDLLSSRLGVDYCFATWSFHANELLKKYGGENQFIQVGIRQSGKDKAHWEKISGIRQYWPDELQSRNKNELIEEMINHLKIKNVKEIYFSNDIDGTDETFAKATGTPANNGVHPDFFLDLISSLGNEFRLRVADIMEVAPFLGTTPEETKQTVNLACDYSIACLQAQIKNG